MSAFRGFADGLAVVHGFGVGQQFQVLLNAVRNLEQDVAARGSVCFAPGVGSGMGGVQRQFYVFCRGARSLCVHLAADGRDDVEVLAFDGRDKLAADEVVVLRLVGDFGTWGAWGCVDHDVSSMGLMA